MFENGWIVTEGRPGPGEDSSPCIGLLEYMVGQYIISARVLSSSHIFKSEPERIYMTKRQKKGTQRTLIVANL